MTPLPPSKPGLGWAHVVQPAGRTHALAGCHPGEVGLELAVCGFFLYKALSD